MKIALVSGTINCLPLLQFLTENNLQTQLFTGEAKLLPEVELEINHYCSAFNVQVSNKGNLYSWLQKVKPDVVFILGYSKLIKLDRIDSILKNKIFNIHFGLLPENKGPSPLFWQLKNGGKKLGMTIHRVNEKFDDGSPVWAKKIDNEDHINYSFLEFMFSQLTIEGVAIIINQLMQFGTVLNIEAKHNQPSYFPKPTLKDVLIDWDGMAAEEILNLVKACNFWNKGAATFYKGLELKILDAEIISCDNKDKLDAGTLVQLENGLAAICIGNKAIKLNALFFNRYVVTSRFFVQNGICKGEKMTNYFSSSK